MAKKEEESAPVDFNSIYENFVSNIVTECEKADGINNSLDDGYYVPTGLHVLDFILNGGVRSGWFTTVGYEASGKSALAVKMLGGLAHDKIPGYYLDPENSLNTESACSIMNIKSVDEVFGVRSPTGKGWEVPPVIRYSPENILETVFTFMKRILLNLPDKIYRQETKKWYYVFTKEKKEVAMMKALGLKPIQKLYSETGKYWCEAPNGRFQYAFFIDSLANLTTSAVGEEEDGGSNAMALDARAFSKYVKTVRGLLRRKHAVVIAINQLRDKPGVMFGSPQYEPGGNSLKYACDCRNELSTRVVPPGWESGVTDAGGRTTTFGQEDSVEGKGVDKYVYKNIKNTKNKAGTPFRQGWCRLWISDYQGLRRGFDPVFDCLKYLESTKQLKIKNIAGRREITFAPGIISLKKVMQYEDFKKLIIAEVFNKPEIAESVLKEYELESNPNFNKLCDEQLRSGEIFTKMLTIEDGDSSIETKSLDELNEDELQEEVDDLDEMDVSSKNKNLDSIDDDIDF